MSVDVACGESAFVDLTFVALDAVPAPGEERHARDFLRSPGGAATTAIGVRRLGLKSVLASPLGADAEGDYLRGELVAEGIAWTGREVARTPVTAVMPADGERAMATFDPGEAVTAAELIDLEARAVVLSLPRLALAPPDAALYATSGEDHARAGLVGDLPALAGARALLVNDREARLLTGAGDPEEAARRLARSTPCAVVTLGAGGALAARGSEVVRVSGVAVEAVDTTGAGDLFAAAYVWADLQGAALEERLQWAVLYAALSVRVPTAAAGAAYLEELAQAGERHGLGMPPIRPTTMSTMRRTP